MGTILMSRCVYCLKDKPSSEFNTEHVLNYAFGTFEENLTLSCVCTRCNKGFGDSIDRKIARDSVESVMRVRHGLLGPSELKSEGARTTTVIRFQEGPLTGAFAKRVATPDGSALGVQPLPQVGFARSRDGVFEWHLLSAVPTKDAIRESLGLQKGDTFFIQIQGTSPEAALPALEASGFDVTPALENLGRPSGHAEARTVWTIGSPELRSIAKIGMNYLASTQGAAIARMPQFNDVRRFVDAGVVVPDHWLWVDQNSLVPTHRDGTPVKRGHFLAVQVVDGDVYAQVCLFLRMRYTMRLAHGGFALPIGFASSHIFDLETRTVHVARIPPLSLRQPRLTDGVLELAAPSE